MAFIDWFSRRSPLQLALTRACEPGGNLENELKELGDYKIQSRSDAEAICDALARLVHKDATVNAASAFEPLIGLFQDVESRDCPAFAVMADKGIGLIREIVEKALLDHTLYDKFDVLFALKILAMYGTSNGTDVVLRAAKQGFEPEGYLWGVILSAYSIQHPESKRLFEQLSDQLPSGFLAVALLDSASAALRNGAKFQHPFDSVDGKAQVERWLMDDDEEHFSYAVSAAAAIPFISGPEQNSLLAIAFDHMSVNVQLEAAWATARLGSDGGVKWLARSCLDIHVAERARQYLVELGRADAIPLEAGEPEFQAKAEFANWLAHPNELGRPPDEIEVIDQRTLNWPPDYQPKQFWLIQYRIRDVTGLGTDDVGVGLVGSVTFCLFYYKLEQRPPEDCYAIHCYWEMTHQELITETDVEEDSSEYDSLSQQCNIEGVNQIRIVSVVELSSELNYPQKIVTLGKAERYGESGWVVLDGQRSRWYAAAELPKESWEKTVVMVHIGRVILGFAEEPDRRRFLQRAVPERTPEQIIEAYERFLLKVHTDPKQAIKLLRGQSVLDSAFGDYVAAISSARSLSPASCACTTYESLLAAADQIDTSLRQKIYDSFSPLGRTFDQYVDALIQLNRQSEVAALVEKFRPYWDHNLGYGRLGSAAFRSGHLQVAEAFLTKLRDSMENWCRSEEIVFLAEIWKTQGRVEDAHTLMIDALNGLQEQSRTATGNDRKLFEQWFQARRAGYLKLFPDRGEDDLRQNGILVSTLTKPAS